jgi:acetoacetate decarboxylase
MKIEEIRKNAFAMPFSSPAYSKGPYRFYNRETFAVTYETDIDALREIVPEPLKVTDPLVTFEVILMPDSCGFGDYSESGVEIPVIGPDGKPGIYTHMRFLDDAAATMGGREMWGYPKKIASPSLKIEGDALVGRLNYGSVPVAISTMGYKYSMLDLDVEYQKTTTTPGYLLKIIPNPDGTPAICQLVRLYSIDVVMKGAWTGPADLQLFHHALAPVAKLPVRKIVSAKHILQDLTLGPGEIVHDYLKP